MLSFSIPGQPKGKGRPRASVIPSKTPGERGRARLYTPSDTATYENRVALAAEAALQGRLPYDEAVEVMVRVRLAPPAGASKKARAAMLAGGACTRLPDADNVAKAVLDGCNKVAFSDDKLITKLLVEKVWAAFPGVDVLIRPRAETA